MNVIKKNYLVQPYDEKGCSICKTFFIECKVI